MSQDQPGGGLDWDLEVPGQHARNTTQSSGGNGWFTKPKDPTAEMGKFLTSIRTRYKGTMQGYNSAAEVRLWYDNMENALVTRAQISNRLFPTLSPALATHWAASLTTMLFTEQVPLRVTVQNNVLYQPVAEYNAAVIVYVQVRQRYITPVANLLLYEVVHEEKRAEIAQALTAVRGGVQEVGDVADYNALKTILSSSRYTLMETLDNAVWNKGVASALTTSGSASGSTRTVVLAMNREQINLYDYATAGHAAAIAAAAGNNAATVFSIEDVKQMCARLVLGHHLKKTIAPRVLETFRKEGMFLITAVAPATEPTVRLEVPLPDDDANNVVQRQDIHIKKGWLAAYSSVVSVKRADKKANRAAPAVVVAEAAAATFTYPSAAPAKRTRVERPQQRRDVPAAVSSGGGSRPAVNAETRQYGQRQPAYQQPPRGGAGAKATAQLTNPQHRSGANGPPMANKPIAQHGMGRYGASSAGPTDKSVPANYVCWNCGTKGEHTVKECRTPRVLCRQCGYKHAPGKCLGYLRIRQ